MEQRSGGTLEHPVAESGGARGRFRSLAHLVVALAVVASVLAIGPNGPFHPGSALALNTVGPPTPVGPGPGPGTPGQPLPGSGTVCWSADGGVDGGASLCSGCPCSPCKNAPARVPLDNNPPHLDVAQEGLMKPFGPSNGWTCGVPGNTAPPVPAFTWPPLNVVGVTSVPNGKVDPTFKGPVMLVQESETAALNPCPLAALIPGRVTTPYAPNVAPPPVGAAPEYVTTMLGPPAGCANSLTINGQNANYIYRLHEINVVEPAPGCSVAHPYRWNWSVGISPAIVNSSFCGDRNSSFIYEHVINAPGVSASSTVSWTPYCGGFVFSNASGTTSTFPLTPGAQTQNGITMTCDAGPNVQTFTADPPRPVDQIEALPAG